MSQQGTTRLGGLATFAAHPAIKCSLVGLVLMKDSRLNIACGTKDDRGAGQVILIRDGMYLDEQALWKCYYLGVGVDAGHAFWHLPALEMLQRYHQVEELRRQAEVGGCYSLPADVGPPLHTASLRV